MAVAQYYGTGRRKTSVARVRLVPGQGKITVNKKELNEYFGRKTLELVIKQPLVLTGVTEQYGDFRQALKKAGFLTRDPREKERRKYGLKKARKASQFSKR